MHTFVHYGMSYSASIPETPYMAKLHGVDMNPVHPVTTYPPDPYHNRPDLAKPRLFRLFGRKGSHKFSGHYVVKSNFPGSSGHFCCIIVHRYAHVRASLNSGN